MLTMMVIVDFIAFGVDERIPNDYNGNFTVLINNNNKFIVKNIPNPNKFWFHNGSVGDLNGDGFVDVAKVVNIFGMEMGLVILLTRILI